MKLLLIIPLFISIVTSGQVIFKNTGWSKVYVAIGYLNNGSWTTKGWFPVEPNEQKAVYNYTILSNPNFYYSAKIEGCDIGYAGTTTLYVNTTNNFIIPNADKDAQYESNLVQKYKFVQINLRGRNSYIIELKPVNLTCYGKPQGKWRLSLDRDGNYAEKKEDVVYYREITFDQGRPLGWCNDYYSDGKLRAEFKLASYNPPVFDGKCTWYKQDGSIERQELYKNGSPISITSFNDNLATEKKVRYEVVPLPVQNFYLNSTSNETWKGGSSKTVYPVQLPEGTVEWFYEFTASRNQEEVRNNTKVFSLVSKLTSLVDKTGILSASVNMFTAPPGGKICNLYLLDGNDYDNFLADRKFEHYPSGSRLNYKSGIVQVRERNIVQPFIAIKNPDGYYGIHVSLQVVTVVAKLE